MPGIIFFVKLIARIYPADSLEQSKSLINTSYWCDHYSYWENSYSSFKTQLRYPSLSLLTVFSAELTIPSIGGVSISLLVVFVAVGDMMYSRTGTVFSYSSLCPWWPAQSSCSVCEMKEQSRENTGSWRYVRIPAMYLQKRQEREPAQPYSFIHFLVIAVILREEEPNGLCWASCPGQSLQEL